MFLGGPVLRDSPFHMLPRAIWFLLFISIYSWPVVLADDGGWRTDASQVVGEDELCNVPHRRAADFTQKEFLDKYAYSSPVIITNLDAVRKKNEVKDFLFSCTKEELLKRYGDVPVKLSSANTYSYTKVPVLFKEYVDSYLQPQSLNRLGNETLYLFGDINVEDWKSLLDKYPKPYWTLPFHRPALTLGIAGAGTGVPFHFHGPGFAEVIYGRKRWFLYPPDVKPEFDPDHCTLHWYKNVYPRIPEEEKPLECLLHPNEVIYFPDRWWHSTLNAETSVFISTFLAR